MSTKDQPPAWDSAKDREDSLYVFGRVVVIGIDHGLDELDAKNCATEAVTQAWEKRGQYQPRPGHPWSSWALTIGRNIVRDFLRRRSAEARMRRAPEVSEHEGAATSEMSIRARANQCQATLLEQLTADERRLFQAWARQLDGEVSPRDAAEALGWTLPEYEAAKKRLRRKINKLGNELRITLDDVAPLPEVVSMRASDGEEEDDGTG